MNTENRVMTVLANANPMPEDDSLELDTDAVTYLATLDQRSSNLTQLDTRTKERTRVPRRPVWLLSAAAVVLIAALGALLLFANNDSDVAGDVETTGTTLCGPVEHVDFSQGDYEGTQECKSDSTDDRLDGTFILDYTHAGDAVWQGTIEMVNEGGSWTGTFFGTESNGMNTTEFELVGGGGYEGLIYTGTGTSSDSIDGSGFGQGSGVISVSD